MSDVIPEGYEVWKEAEVNHVMRFGGAEYTVEVSQGTVGLNGRTFDIPAANIATPASTIRALLLDAMGIERIADTARKQIEAEAKTTRTAYGPGTHGEWDVNLG